MSVNDILESLNLLQLDCVPNEWSDWAWDQEFMDITERPIPDEYGLYLEDVDLDIGLGSARSAVDDWVSSANDASWHILVQQYNVDTKKLLPVLCYLISTGLANPMDETWRRICVEAANLYLSFLTIPGSYPFMIFHPNLLSKALGCLKLGTRLSVRPKKKPKNYSNRRHSSQEDDLVEDSFEDGQPALQENEKVLLLRNLNSFILNLMLMLKKFSVNSQPDSLEHIVQRLVDVTRLEVTTSDFRFGRRSSAELSRPTIFTLAFNAYTAIGSLCRSFHGNIQDTVTLITQYLLPSIMMVPASGTSPTPKDLSVIKDHTVYFLQFLMLKLKDDADRGITILIQHLCTKMQDRAELRQKGAQVVVDLMRSLPMNAYSKLMLWIFKFAYHEKAFHRLFALEVIAKLLYEVERHCQDADGGAEESGVDNLELSFSHVGPLSEPSTVVATPAEENRECVVQRSLHRDVPSHRFLLAVVFSRCSDSSGTVRTKALQTLAECSKSNNSGINALMKEIFVNPYVNISDILQSNVVENDFICYQRFLRMLRNSDHSHLDPLPGAKAVFRMLNDRISDKNVFVRKTALHVIENLLHFNEKCLNYELLKTLFNFCRDPALLVRKHMIHMMTDLLIKYPHNETLPVLWVDYVLPRIVDPETSAQEKVLECLQELILKNLTVSVNMTRAAHKLPFKMLRIITANDKRTYLYNACFSWSKSNWINERVVTLVKSYVETAFNEPAWVMLAAMSEYIDFDPTLVLHYYEHYVMPVDVCPPPETIMVGGLVAETLRNLWPKVAISNQLQLCTQLIANLTSLSIAIPLIRPTIDLLLATAPIRGHPEVAVDVWAPNLIQECDPIWRDNVTLMCSGEASLAEVTVFLKALVTYADCIQWCPKMLHKSTIHPIKKLWRDVPIYPVTEEVGYRPALIVVIGKLSVTSDEFANQAVPFLGGLLKDKCPAVIKINIINIFYDMCIRCTSLVEPALGDVCLSLRDNVVTVREKTLVTLIQLLQEDFLKIRPDLYYNMLTMLCDKQPNIQSMASYYLTTCLSSKHPNFIYSHFIQSIFYYNNYQDHHSYSQPRTAGDIQQFRLNREDRQLVYRFMLDNITDDHRYSLTRKLCSDVLNGVSEGSVSLDGSGVDLIRDSLYVLGSEEIRLSTLRSRLDDEPPVNESEMATVILASTRKVKLSQLVKKNVVENTVPIIIRLKKTLDNKKSPLVTDLMIYLRDLMRDYQSELVDILREDRALAAQVLGDVKALEEQEKAARQRLREGARRGTANSNGTNVSDSSESDDFLNQSPLPSPGRPVVPAEVESVMDNLTPQVRRNVEPFLANVCQQVMYHAKSVSASPAHSTVSSADVNFKTPLVSQFRPSNAKTLPMRRCSVVMEKIPSARIKLLMSQESKEKKTRCRPVKNGNPVITKECHDFHQKISMDPANFAVKEVGSNANSTRVNKRTSGDNYGLKPCWVALKNLDVSPAKVPAKEVVLYAHGMGGKERTGDGNEMQLCRNRSLRSGGITCDRDLHNTVEDFEQTVTGPSKTNDDKQLEVQSKKDPPTGGEKERTFCFDNLLQSHSVALKNQDVSNVMSHSDGTLIDRDSSEKVEDLKLRAAGYSKVNNDGLVGAPLEGGKESTFGDGNVGQPCRIILEKQDVSRGLLQSGAILSDNKKRVSGRSKAYGNWKQKIQCNKVLPQAGEKERIFDRNSNVVQPCRKDSNKLNVSHYLLRSGGISDDKDLRNKPEGLKQRVAGPSKANDDWAAEARSNEAAPLEACTDASRSNCRESKRPDKAGSCQNLNRFLYATCMSPSLPGCSKSIDYLPLESDIFNNCNGSSTSLNHHHLHLDAYNGFLETMPEAIASCSTPHKDSAPKLGSVFNELDYAFSDSDDD